MPSAPPTTWVEVNAAALAANLDALRPRLAPGCEIAAVVKANAYGHGLVEAGRVFLEAGALMLAVTTLEEGLRLREAGINAPVLSFAAPAFGQAPALVAAGITASVSSAEAARSLSEAAVAQGCVCALHLKVDSGMGRLGCLPDEAPDLARAIAGLPGLSLDGLYTHFATPFTRQDCAAALQLQQFLRARCGIIDAGIRIPYTHVANSAAILGDNGLREMPMFNLVRPGTVLYGQLPADAGSPVALRSTWTYKTRALLVKWIPRGGTVGYGCEFVARRRTRVCVLPAGYVDGIGVEPASTMAGWRGLRRALAQRARGRRPGVTFGGRPAPFLGRIAAQLCCVDVTHLMDVMPGDEAVLPARRTLVPASVPRIYGNTFSDANG